MSERRRRKRGFAGVPPALPGRKPIHIKERSEKSERRNSPRRSPNAGFRGFREPPVRRAGRGGDAPFGDSRKRKGAPDAKVGDASR